LLQRRPVAPLVALEGGTVTRTVRNVAELIGAAVAACALLGATLLFASAARAERTQGGGSGGHPPGPPPQEAVQACAQKASGAACSFSIHGHDLSGACWAPEGKPLACKPDRPPPQGDGSGQRPE
jgi:hypothetical protein